jgi:hypothetical protein
MTYIAHILIILLLLVLDIGLVATLDNYAGPWPSEGVLTYMVKLLVAPFYLLICGIQQISNFLFKTNYEV